MKAIVVENFGEVDVLQLSDWPKPQIKEHEVLIEQFATSINPSDWKKRQGIFGGKLPYIPGNDGAGMVCQIGSAVTELKPGDRVMANAAGTYSEYATAKASLTTRIPDTIPFTEAAGVPLAGQTAYQALVEVGQLEAGQKVCILGGSGGVGTLAIQIAKYIGAEIIATGSKANEMFLYSLGVDEVVDYQAEDLSQKTSNVDLVLDAIGGKSQIQSMSLLKKGGRLVTLAQLDKEAVSRHSDITAVAFSMKPKTEGMEFLGKMLSEGHLRTFVQEVFPFTENGIRQAQTISQQGHVRGKLVVEIKKETENLLLHV